MSGLFGTLNIAKKSINAHQTIINTVSHNVANADTDGYSRQRVSLEASRAITYYNIGGATQLGTGVDINSISRVRDQFLDSQIRREMSKSEQYKARDEFLSEIETLTLEPSYDDGPGLSVLVGKMWDAWQEFSMNPEDSNTRTGVVQATKTVTDTMNNIYEQLEGLNTHSNDLARSKVYDFNTTISEIEILNGQILSVKAADQEPNDLLDKQDLLIDKLSSMINIDVHRDDYDRVTITTKDEDKGDITLVGDGKQSLSFVEGLAVNADGTGTLKYSINGDLKKTTTADIDKDKVAGFEGAKLIWIDGNGKISSKADTESGSIEGYLSVTNDITGYQDKLNALAKAIAYSVNMLHNDGYKCGVPASPEVPAPLVPALPYPYVPVFVAGGEPDEGTIANEDKITAGNITVASDLGDNLRAWSSAEVPADREGNGDRALSISRLRDTKLDINQFLPQDDPLKNKNRTNNSFAYNAPAPADSNPYSSIEDDPTGATIEGYYRSFVVEVGTSASMASTTVHSQNTMLDQLQTRKESISGVSINEETANLIQYQHSLDASFKIVSVVDELLSSVINLIK